MINWPVTSMNKNLKVSLEYIRFFFLESLTFEHSVAIDRVIWVKILIRNKIFLLKPTIHLSLKIWVL